MIYTFCVCNIFIPFMEIMRTESVYAENLIQTMQSSIHTLSVNFDHLQPYYYLFIGKACIWLICILKAQSDTGPS